MSSSVPVIPALCCFVSNYRLKQFLKLFCTRKHHFVQVVFLHIVSLVICAGNIQVLKF